MKKYRRKFKQFIGRIKKLKIGTRAMNLAMLIIGWFLVVGFAIALVQGFQIKTVVSDDSMIPTFEEETPVVEDYNEETLLNEINKFLEENTYEEEESMGEDY